MIPVDQIVGIHKRDRWLVIRTEESDEFCLKCLANVPTSEIDFDNEDPCLICQLPGGPVTHARAIGMKHDFVAPEPEIPPYGDAELAIARSGVSAIPNPKLRNQILRLFATVDYWIEEARHEAELRQPAIDERDQARRDLSKLLSAVDKTISTRVDEIAKSHRIEALRLNAAAMRAIAWATFVFGRWEVRCEWKLQDSWIGAYWNDVVVPIDGALDLCVNERHVWVCLVPWLPIHVIYTTPNDR